MPVRHHHVSKLADKLAERFTFQQPGSSQPPHRDSSTAPQTGQREPQPPVGLPREVEDFALEYRQRRFRPDGRHQARHQPEQGKLT